MEIAAAGTATGIAAFKEHLDGPVESRLSRRSSQGCGVRLRVDETIKIKSRVALKLGYDVPNRLASDQLIGEHDPLHTEIARHL